MTEEQYLEEYPGAYLGFGEHRFMANNSAFWTGKPDRATFDQEWSALQASGSGERGFFMFPPAKRAERRGDCRANPCLTGDTLVAVADGRGSVSFRALAAAGEDVPVYCYDENREVVVRKMRAPRRTGTKTPVFKVTLDDGSTFRATDNHRFVTREGVEKRVDELQPGDRLQVLSRWLAPTKKGGQDYWWVSGGWQGTGMEHRRIAEFHMGRPLNEDEVVHHKDYEGSNNDWGNLEPMLKTAHDDLHRQDMLGDNNPMRRASKEWSEEKWAEYRANMSESTSGERNGKFCGEDHDALFEFALSLTRGLGRMATHAEWCGVAEANGLPTYFSQWRRQNLGTIRAMLRRAAVKLGYETPQADARVVRNFHKWLERGYDVEVQQGLLVFTKQCEKCGGDFTTARREHGICTGCGSTYPRAFQHLPEHLSRTDQQVRIYNQLKLAFGGSPPRDSFSDQCKEEGVSHVVAPRSWERFEQHCSDANHIIVSIEADGDEDVYNGTVDEFHNFFIGGWESKTNGGKLKQQFVNTQNCGEILLRYAKSTDPWTGEGGGGQFCNLTAAVMRAEDTRETFANKIIVATWMGALQATFTHFPHLRPAWKAHCFTGDTQISLLNGEEVALRDLVGRETFWVYSYDLESGKMVPGLAHSVRKTRKNAELVRVTLDNGEHFDCTPDHLILTRSSVYKEAGKLSSGDSLMPLYRRLSTEEDEGRNGRIGYEMCSTGDCYEFTHALTANAANQGCCAVCGVSLPDEKHCIRHHADFNKRNNDPTNFQWLTWVDHNRLHSEVASAMLTEMWKDPEFRQKMAEVRKDWWEALKADPERYAVWSARYSEILSGVLNRLWADPTYRETTLARLSEGHQTYLGSDRFQENQARHLQALWSDPDFVEKFMSAAREGVRRKWSDDEYREKMREVSRSLWTDEFKEMMRPHQSRNGKLYGKKNLVEGWNQSDAGRSQSAENLRYERTSEHRSAMSLVAKKHTHVRWHVERGQVNPDCQFCSPNNHKVVSVEALPYTEDVYDLTVDAHHNFALSCGVFVHNCDEDRLLGVDITGHCDNPELSGDAESLLYFNQVARETAARAASHLGIPMPVSITTGKPSGNSSQVVDCASGFHTRFSPYYIRRVRISSTDPLFHLVRAAGAPCFKDNKYTNVPDEECPTWVVEFPVKSPEGAVLRDNETALMQLERYLKIMETWCSNRGHNQSATVYVRPNEWGEVGDWLFENFDKVTGLSFLPYDGGKYSLAPYEEIDQDTYELLVAEFPDVDYSLLQKFETEDMGTGAQELACVGGSCEIDWEKLEAEAAVLPQPEPESCAKPGCSFHFNCNECLGREA